MIAPVDISGVTIETPRLILRPWKTTDLQDFFEYASVDGVGQMAGWLPHESLEKSQQILNMFLDGKDTFAIVLKENNKFSMLLLVQSWVVLVVQLWEQKVV